MTTDHKNDDKTKTVTYTYDKAGNRTTEDDGTTQTAYTYNGLDQLQTATKEKGTTVDEVRQYSYDANGNQTDVKNTKTGQTESYTYDAENRLSKVSVTDKDGKTAVIQQNRYNGDGQRIQKVEGSKTTNYYYQDGVVSYTTDGDNIQTSQNLIGTDGNILATQRYGSDHTDYLLYHKDIQGSTTSLVKEDGSADATYQYTDFGETTINGDNKAENEVCYTGGIYDQSTGLYYLNARYYNPEDGRFVTEDSYRGESSKPDTQNLYVYCANSPVNYVDSSGHVPVRLVNAILGGAVGVATDVLWGAMIYKVIHRNLKGFKVSGKSIASSFVSGGIDALLFSSRWKRKVMILANSTKAGIKSYLDNRRKNIKTLVYNVFLDVALTLALNLKSCKNGIARKYWNRGLYRKGSYKYKTVTIKYGTRIKITSRSFKMTKAVFKESCGELIGGAKGNVIISAIKLGINKIRRYFKRK